jgi:hypothetical protein
MVVRILSHQESQNFGYFFPCLAVISGIQTSTNTTLRASRNKTAFDYEWWDETVYLVVNERTIRESDEF